MSRMSQEDFRRVADARRAVWTGSFVGLGAGLSVGVLGQAAARAWAARAAAQALEALGEAAGAKARAAAAAAAPLSWWRPKHTMFSVLVCGAAGSLVGATRWGSTAIPRLADVFDRYRTPAAPYEAKVHKERREREDRERGERDALLATLQGRGRAKEEGGKAPGESGSSSSSASAGAVRYDADPFAVKAGAARTQ
jgi:hypothetical protein